MQVYENIHEGFSFSVTLKANFCNNFLLQICSLVGSCCIEIRVLLSATLQKKLAEVSSLVISEQILFKGVFKPNQISKMEFITEK